jgi:hydrogenase maturation protein HypF
MSVVTVRSDQVRHRIRVAGVVQGVGFRPYVHRLASELGLAGHVGNDAAGVVIEVEGAPGAVERFEGRLARDAPPLARVDAVETDPVAVLGEARFRIVESGGGAGRTYVSPDVAVCDDCLAELRSADDRRYRHPFITCTNCGPRFTITERLPYDRPNTTMAGFELCPACAAQYHDPGDRRFHAQPLACPACGPHLWFEGHDGGDDGDAMAAAWAVLDAGGIVAVKGVGGFHLACDARSDAAVGELRRRKHRPGKPFAVMVADLAAAASIAAIGAAEAAALSSPARPIVLIEPRSGSGLSPLVAPASPHLGVLLAYTPVHHLLLDERGRGGGPAVLVMTSGNLSDEPICFDDNDARRRLGDIADGWLMHDRPIHVPCDDSVVRITDGGELPIRRSRGYAPLPVRLPFEVPPVLAAGADLKNAFCVASGRDAWMSQHIGDMGSVETLAAFERSTRQFLAMYRIDPGVVVADAHPGYLTRRWAEERSGRPIVTVQHHHAHVAAVMVDHGVPAGQRVVGFAFDGTGYGDDGAIWGGEVLVAGYDACRRVAHLRYVALPGGDHAVRKPYRCALSHLRAAGIPWSSDLAPVAAAGDQELAGLERQLERDVNCVPTSSMGRLWDAVSSLIGLCQVSSYEAEAPVALEAAADAALASLAPADVPSYRLAVDGGLIDPAPLLEAVVADIRVGRAAGAVAAGFHVAVARLVGALAGQVAGQEGLDRIVLCGGVWQNALLTRLVRQELAGRPLTVLTARVVPPNDGGLALGQAAVAGYRLSEGGRLSAERRHEGELA